MSVIGEIGFLPSSSFLPITSGYLSLKPFNMGSQSVLSNPNLMNSLYIITPEVSICVDVLFHFSYKVCWFSLKFSKYIKNSVIILFIRTFLECDLYNVFGRGVWVILDCHG